MFKFRERREINERTNNNKKNDEPAIYICQKAQRPVYIKYQVFLLPGKKRRREVNIRSHSHY
jgi:hypothetical protein